MIADAPYSMRGASRIWFFDNQMCLAVHQRSDSPAQDFRDDGSRFTGAVDAKIRLLVGRQALGVEFAEAGHIAKERPAGHGHAARQKNFNGRIQPHHGNAGSAKKLECARLGVGAATEGENGAFLQFQRTAERRTQLLRFDLAEHGFAKLFENPWNGEACGFFDEAIQIDEPPCQLASEETANGGLAGAHEPGEAEDLSTRLRPA